MINHTQKSSNISCICNSNITFSVFGSIPFMDIFYPKNLVSLTLNWHFLLFYVTPCSLSRFNTPPKCSCSFSGSPTINEPSHNVITPSNPAKISVSCDKLLLHFQFQFEGVKKNLPNDVMNVVTFLTPISSRFENTHLCNWFLK